MHIWNEKQCIFAMLLIIFKIMGDATGWAMHRGMFQVMIIVWGLWGSWWEREFGCGWVSGSVVCVCHSPLPSLLLFSSFLLAPSLSHCPQANFAMPAPLPSPPTLAEAVGACRPPKWRTHETYIKRKPANTRKHETSEEHNTGGNEATYNCKNKM